MLYDSDFEIIVIGLDITSVVVTPPASVVIAVGKLTAKFANNAIYPTNRLRQITLFTVNNNVI